MKKAGIAGDDLPDLIVVSAGVLLISARLGLVASVSAFTAFLLYGSPFETPLIGIFFACAVVMTLAGARMLRVRVGQSLRRSMIQSIAFSAPIVLFFVGQRLMAQPSISPREVLAALCCAATWIGYVALQPKRTEAK